MRRPGIHPLSRHASSSRSANARSHPNPLTLTLCVLALTALASPTTPSRAQQPADNPAALPSAQLPTAPAAHGPGAITGFVADADDASISKARLTLTPDPPAAENPTPPPIATTSEDGAFTLANVPPGPFLLTIAAPGFATRQLPGTLHPSETLDLSTIILTAAGAATEVHVTASQTEIAQAQIGEEEKQRVLGVIPNFYVSYVSHPVPLTPSQKFQLAFRTLIDPVNLILNGVAAGAEQATDTYAWGEGVEGYTKRYSAAYGSFLTSDMIGDAALPILFKQDPRYFYKGTGSIHSRFYYAVANAVICKGDNGRWQVNYSAILGGIASGAIANLYYPAVNRTGAALTFESAGIGTAISAAGNLFQEFLIPHLTPHIPPRTPSNP
ncbi:MAG: carboxypeptidase-like regulatory domain-containing protein [Acidobacteriaceae bacterium]